MSERGNMQPLVSVIVPVYNVEKTLDRCISSIVNQTYHNLEIILVDDGSPDNCPQICDEWAKRDVRIKVVHKHNEGLGMARNTGMNNAKGDYLCFVDSDDFLDLTAVQKACQMICEFNADLALFGVSYIDSNGNIRNSVIPKTNISTVHGEEIQNLFLADLIDGWHKNIRYKGLYFSAWSCFFSKKVIDKAAWRFVSERNIISEDFYSLLALYAHVNSVALIHEALYYYCENNQSLTKSYRPDRFSQLKVLYSECINLAGTIGYSDYVHEAIAGMFLAQTIAAMKQIAAHGCLHREKCRLLESVIHDNTVIQCLQTVRYRKYGIKREILHSAMRYKRVKLCYLLLRAQNLLL